MRRGSGTAPDTRVHTTEPRVQNVFQLAKCYSIDIDLTRLRNDDESFASNVERVGLRYIAGQNQNKSVTWAEAIIRIYRPIEIRIEERRHLAEHRQSEDLEAAVLLRF